MQLNDNFQLMHNLILFITVLATITGCNNARIQPLSSINSTILRSSTSNREPSLGQRWLATLSKDSGKERVELIDLKRRIKVPLPGLNRQDAQPISVSVNSNGSRLALIRQRDGNTELLLYRRNFGTTQILGINPKGVPRKVSIDGNGRLLAVQVSRNGLWEVDIIQISN